VDGSLLENLGLSARRLLDQRRGGPRRGGDRCPGALELHRAADGWLARLRVPGGRTTSAQLAVIADLADRGNGIVELTSRANLQVRGLTPDAMGETARRLAAVGLLPSPAHERVRNVLASPLAGRHRRSELAADDVVAALDRGLCADPALADLPGRVLFLVEDGSGVLAGLRHDMALAPDRSGGIALLIDGIDSGVRAATADGAAAMVLGAAHAFRDASHEAGVWSVRELSGGAAGLIERLSARADTSDELSWPRVAPRPLAAGRERQADGRFAVTALAPLGRLSPDQLRVLAGAAPDVRVSPWRTVTVLDVPEPGVARLERVLAAAELILEPGSGWSGLSACAGMGACSTARADVRAAAASRAAVRAPAAPGEHWAACPRRCGEHPGTPVAVAVLDDGVAVRRGADEVLVDDVEAAVDLLGARS